MNSLSAQFPYLRRQGNLMSAKEGLRNIPSSRASGLIPGKE